ncbi:MAG: hypothetical protein ACOVNY_08290 [Chitinophagaceae bacterium]
MKKKLISICFILFSVFVQAQDYIKIAENYSQDIYEKQHFNDSSLVFALKPYIRSTKTNSTNIIQDLRKSNQLVKRSKNLFSRLFVNGNLFTDSFKNGAVTINPLFDLSIGQSNKRIYNFNRGVQFSANINNKFFISTVVYENFSAFPTYIQQYIDSLTVVPGAGKARPNTTNTAFDYNIPRGFFMYAPSTNFSVEIGNDKNFIGSGIRSLILSDFAYAYPYVKIRSNFGKFSMMNLWSQFVDPSRNWVNQNGYEKKFASINTLTYKGIKNTQLTLYQSLVWTNRDTLGNINQSFNLYNLVPFIYMNSLNFNDGSPANSMMGIDLNYKYKKNLFYFQFLVDDFNVSSFLKGSGFFQQKTGIQIGVKSFDVFKIPNTFLRYEFNTVRPYTYANKIPQISFTHYNEALAHPLGANFKEHILAAHYTRKKLLFECTLMYALYGKDTQGKSWGQNIYTSDYESALGLLSFGNKTLQGLKTTLQFYNIRVNYLLNPVTNMRAFVNFIHRSEKNTLKNNRENILSIGIATRLFNDSNLF